MTAAEEYFTSHSMIDVKELKENHPESALVLDMNEDRLPNTTDLAYKRVLVHNIEVGSYVLVRAGEVCDANFIHFSFVCWNSKLECSNSEVKGV